VPILFGILFRSNATSAFMWAGLMTLVMGALVEIGEGIRTWELSSARPGSRFCRRAVGDDGSVVMEESPILVSPNLD
jgi:hypothetical protein